MTKIQNKMHITIWRANCPYRNPDFWSIQIYVKGKSEKTKQTYKLVNFLSISWKIYPNVAKKKWKSKLYLQSVSINQQAIIIKSY